MKSTFAVFLLLVSSLAQASDYKCQEVYEKETQSRIQLAESMSQTANFMNGPAAYAGLAMIFIAPVPGFSFFFLRSLAFRGMSESQGHLDRMLEAQSMVEEAMTSREAISNAAESIAQMRLNEILHSEDEDDIERRAAEAAVSRPIFAREEFESPIEKMIERKRLRMNRDRVAQIIRDLGNRNVLCQNERPLDINALIRKIKDAR